MGIDDFRNDLVNLGDLDIVEKYYTTPGALHVDDSKIAHIRSVIAAAYAMDPSDIDVFITGSAKIGFTTFDKKLEDGSIREKYSPFDISSDIDVSVISSKLFHEIWLELSNYSARKAYFPWTAGRLGDYIICGWLRPDHFPRAAHLYQTREWWPTFQRLSRSSYFERRRVNGALFQSRDHFNVNLERIVRAARRQEQET